MTCQTHQSDGNARITVTPFSSWGHGERMTDTNVMSVKYDSAR